MPNRKLGKITAICFLICISYINGEVKKLPTLSELLPRIDQTHFQLIPNGQRYSLYVSQPDGSNRYENAELLAPGTPEQELYITGKITEVYTVGSWVTFFEAGRKGYRVKYEYVAIGAHPPTVPICLSPAGLKSAAG